MAGFAFRLTGQSASPNPLTLYKYGHYIRLVTRRSEPGVGTLNFDLYGWTPFFRAGKSMGTPGKAISSPWGVQGVGDYPISNSFSIANCLFYVSSAGMPGLLTKYEI